MYLTDLNIIKYWFDLNYTALSTKTRCLFFINRGTAEAGHVYYKCHVCVGKEILDVCKNCIIIERWNSLKYLGIILDENIN